MRIEENIRFRGKAPSGKGVAARVPSKIRIKELSKDAEGKYIFLTEEGEMQCFRSRQFMLL
jgi:hypothetical protein